MPTACILFYVCFVFLALFLPSLISVHKIEVKDTNVYEGTTIIMVCQRVQGIHSQLMASKL